MPTSRSTHSFSSSFYKAHNFDIHNSTFIDNSGNFKELNELKSDLRKSIIEGATYEELSRKRRSSFLTFEVSGDILDRIKILDPFEHCFFYSQNKNTLSKVGIPTVRLFRNTPTAGVKLVAHILFYDIPITEEAHIITTRKNVSHCWVTTLAYQLMQNIPEITIPMLEALHLEPNLPQLNTEHQLRKLVIDPLEAVAIQGQLPLDETWIILLDCIDCSTDAPSMASDIAFLIEELQLRSLKNIQLKIFVTGSPNEEVMRIFSEVPVVISELRESASILPSYIPHKIAIVDKWAMFASNKKLVTNIQFGVELMVIGWLLSKISGREEFRKITANIVFYWVMIVQTQCFFLAKYLVLRRPWDVHGRKGEVMISVFEFMHDKMTVTSHITWAYRRTLVYARDQASSLFLLGFICVDDLANYLLAGVLLPHRLRIIWEHILEYFFNWYLPFRRPQLPRPIDDDEYRHNGNLGGESPLSNVQYREELTVVDKAYEELGIIPSMDELPVTDKQAHLDFCCS